jgi:hypothetical protein
MRRGLVLLIDPTVGHGKKDRRICVISASSNAIDEITHFSPYEMNSDLVTHGVYGTELQLKQKNRPNDAMVGSDLREDGFVTFFGEGVEDAAQCAPNGTRRGA